MLIDASLGHGCYPGKAPLPLSHSRAGFWARESESGGEGSLACAAGLQVPGGRHKGCIISQPARWHWTVQGLVQVLGPCAALSKSKGLGRRTPRPVAIYAVKCKKPCRLHWTS